MRMLPALALALVLLFTGCPSEKPNIVPAQMREVTPQPPAQPEPSPTPSPASTSDTAPNTDFTGIWSTKDDAGDAFDMIVFPNGQAVTTWTKGIGGAKGERGFWRTENNRLVVVYEDGWTDVLEPLADGFIHKGFSPKTQIGGTPTNSAQATRISGPVATYTGIWRFNKEPDGNYQYVALFSGGRALSTINGGTEGTWEATEKGARCTWPKDGWVDLIEHVGEDWQKRSWVGPETETPADVSPVLRVGEAKFSVTP